MFELTPSVPLTIAPVPVTTNTFALPATEVVTFALAYTNTLLFQFDNSVVIFGVANTSCPFPFEISICPADGLVLGKE